MSIDHADGVRTTYSSGYLAARLQAPPRLRAALSKTALDRPRVRLSSGHEVIVFAADDAAERADRLSIIVPVYNEERYVGEVLNALLTRDADVVVPSVPLRETCCPERDAPAESPTVGKYAALSRTVVMFASRLSLLSSVNAASWCDSWANVRTTRIPDRVSCR